MSSILDTETLHDLRNVLLGGTALLLVSGGGWTGAAMAAGGCNSGDTPNSNLLSSSTCQATANGGDSVAVGTGAAAGGGDAIAIGRSPTANGGSAIAIGFSASAGGSGGVAFGSGASALGASEISLGANSGNNVTGRNGATHIGGNVGVVTSGIFTSALGTGTNFNTAAQATGNYAVAIGGGDGSVFMPIGGPAISLNGAQASGVNSTAMGVASQATASSSSAYGVGSIASALDSAAFGDFSAASGEGSIAIGFFGTATGSRSMALGRASRAGGSNNNSGTMAIGPGTQAGLGGVGQINATAVGINAIANATSSSAFGHSSKANGDYSVALGRESFASSARSVAIGYASVANAADTVSVGSSGNERRITNVANAVNSTDAVNLGQVRALLANGAPATVPVAASSGAALAGGHRAGNAIGRPNTAGGRSSRTLANAAPAGGNSSSTAGDHGTSSQRRDGTSSDKVRQPAGSRVAAAPPAHAAAGVASMSCELGGASVTTAMADHSTASSAFALIQQSGVSFNQGGSKNGCVMLSFSAEALAAGDSLMEVRAVLDGNVEASPGAVYFAQGDDVRTRTFNFVLASVAPGPHRAELQFRNAGDSGAVSVGHRTTMVQFAR